VVIVVLRYEMRVVLSVAQKEVSPYQSLLTSPKKYNMLLEIAVLMLQPYPFLNGTTRIKQT